MWVNFEQSLTTIYMIVMLILFGISEALCITLIHLIMKTLKRNVEVFSKNTYRLHIQLTILLAFQVRLYWGYEILIKTFKIIASTLLTQRFSF